MLLDCLLICLHSINCYFHDDIVASNIRQIIGLNIAGLMVELLLNLRNPSSKVKAAVASSRKQGILSAYRRICVMSFWRKYLNVCLYLTQLGFCLGDRNPFRYNAQVVTKRRCSKRSAANASTAVLYLWLDVACAGCIAGCRPV